MKISKRFKQLLALLTHPKSIASKYDTPWDNVIFSEIRELYDNNRIQSSLFEEFIGKIGVECRPTAIRLSHLHECHRTSGSIAPLELKVVSDICRLVKPGNILEIGTFEGRTTVNIALSVPGSHVFTMNLPQESCAFMVGKHFLGTNEAKRITQIFCDSHRYDFSQLPKMDLIFIDGDHSYEGVVADSENAFCTLTENGIVLWHDFDTCHLGSTKAVLDAVTKHGYSYCCIEGTSIAVAFRNLCRTAEQPKG